MSTSLGQAQQDKPPEPSANPFGGILDTVKRSIGQIATGTDASGKPASVLDAGNAAAAQLSAAQKAAALASINPKLRALFAKGTVTGEDLYDSLTEMRKELLAQRSVKAYAQLNLSLTALTSSAALTGKLDFGTVVETVAMPAFVALVKSYAATTAMQALDEHLQYLLEDRRAALGAETIKITLPDGADQAQAKRVVTMATMIVAARVTKKMLDKADQDFKSLRTDYTSLLKQREAAADILIRVLDERRAAMRGTDPAQRAKVEAELLQSLSQKDLAYIDTALNTMSFKEFNQDMAAQNLAINFMRGKDPEKYKDYRVKADDVVRRTQGYVRTMSGIVAFGSLTMNFAKSVAEMGAQKQLENLLSAMPMIGEFATVAAPLGQKSVEMAFTGITLPLTGDGVGILDRFQRKAFVVTKGDKSQVVGSVADVFQAMKSGPEAELFGGALFLSDRAGWLRRIYECDRGETGRMVDATVPKELRVKFAAEHLGYDEGKADEFAFVNAFAAPARTRNEREMSHNLLSTDQRRQARISQVADVQNSVVTNYGSWSNDQFLRLIFHNLESGAAYATLQLGDMSIKPVPSPAAIYAYESRVESCRRTTDRELDGGPSAATGQPAPAGPGAAAAAPAAPKPGTGKPPAKPPAKPAPPKATDPKKN